MVQWLWSPAGGGDGLNEDNDEGLKRLEVGVRGVGVATYFGG